MIIKFSYLFLVSGIAAVSGFALGDVREKRDVSSLPQNCSTPPVKRTIKECCSLPKERIWGNLKSSFHTCSQTLQNQEKMPGNPEMATSQPTDMNYNGKNEKHFSEKIKGIFKKIYTVAKTMINNLKDNVVMIPDSFRRLAKEECFMECVFENSGFLCENKVSKDALLERLKETLKDDDQWLQVATSAVEKCHLTLSNIGTNSTCISGSAPIFHCIHKYLFLNCPNWLENNDYCASLKHFYQQCPDGPPPPIEEKSFEDDFSEDSSKPKM